VAERTDTSFDFVADNGRESFSKRFPIAASGEVLLPVAPLLAPNVYRYFVSRSLGCDDGRFGRLSCWKPLGNEHGTRKAALNGFSCSGLLKTLKIQLLVVVSGVKKYKQGHQ
jgi:hypothetical protein